ncbi:isochorismatase family protein [Paremcibacter congregatus]|uniref:isochorismatase family protein n=1 Tax=Paremcibacter congregatus TaxID=2043170 RepID=UPI0013FD67FC|nr:isochorismatase family protein [Paremcibacter congregatus]
MTTADYIYNILISPEETTLVIIDHQPAFSSCFERQDIDRAEDAAVSLIKAAKSLGIPTIISMVETNVIEGSISLKLHRAIGDAAILPRTGFNPWENRAFTEAVSQANRPRLLIAGLSAETSLSLTALCALEIGYDTYVVKDACLGQTRESYDMSFERLTQAGVVPVSWRQILIEWERGPVEASLLRRFSRSRKPGHKPSVKE